VAIDFRALMEPVALGLLGEPNRELSRGPEWRYGSKGSMLVDVDKGTWFNFELNVGGGVLDLIKNELSGTDPIKWLEWHRTLRRREIVELLAGVAEAAPSGSMSVDTGIADIDCPPREGGRHDGRRPLPRRHRLRDGRPARRDRHSMSALRPILPQGG
jgi:hypothetical protein